MPIRREKGKDIRRMFPGIAISRTEQVLTGTGGKSRFVGNPPKWMDNPFPDKGYTYQFNRMGELRAVAEAFSITGRTDFSGKVIGEPTYWVDTVCPGHIRKKSRSFPELFARAGAGSRHPGECFQADHRFLSQGHPVLHISNRELGQELDRTPDEGPKNHTVQIEYDTFACMHQGGSIHATDP